METAKRTIVLLSLVLFITAAAQSDEKPKVSNTRTASCLVKITSDPAVLPLNYEIIDFLLHSSGVGGKAAREVLSVTPGQVDDCYNIEYEQLIVSEGGIASWSPDMGEDDEYEMMMEEVGYRMDEGPAKPERGSRRTRRRRMTGSTITTSSMTPSEEHTYLFSLIIELPGNFKGKLAAEEFMNVLLHNLHSALSDAFNEYADKLRNQFDLADEEAHRAENDLSDKQERLRVLSGSRILDRAQILNDIEIFRGNIQERKMEQASEQVVMNATTNRIAEIQSKIREEIVKDTVIRELTDLVNLQSENFKNLQKQHESGRSSSTDIADAREKLARSRIELAQRREQLSRSAGGGLIESLNSTLAERSISITQNEMVLSDLEKQLEEADRLLSKADEYELLSLKADIAKQSLRETILWRDRMERRNRLIQQPTVTVLGAD